MATTTSHPTQETPQAVAWSSHRSAVRGATTLSVSVAIVACVVAVAVCAYAFVSFAGAETVTATTRLMIGFAFAVSFFSAVSVNRVLEARDPHRR